MVNAHCSPEDAHYRIGGRLAADAHAYASPLRRIYGHADELQHGGIGRLVEIGDRLVAAVGGHRVLHEVVGADREEVDMARKLVGIERRRGHFDHRADANGVVVGDAVFVELRLDVAEDHRGRDKLVDAAHHRIHDRHIPEGRGAEQGPQLRAENVGVGKEIAYRAVAKEGIGLLRGNAPHKLVAADVERADRYRAAVGKSRCEFRRVAVGDELLLLGRLHLAVEPEVLAAVETDAASALLANPGKRYAGVDVCENRNVAARLESAGRRAASRLFGELKLAFDEVVELADRRLVGI